MLQMHTLYIIQKPIQTLVQVLTATIQSLQQQSDKAHCCHQEQRAHNHGSTGSTNSTNSIHSSWSIHSSRSVHSSGSITKNLRTLAAGHRLVVWIAGVRCSIVTHHIGKHISWCGPELLKWNNSDNRVIFASGAQLKLTMYESMQKLTLSIQVIFSGLGLTVTMMNIKK